MYPSIQEQIAFLFVISRQEKSSVIPEGISIIDIGLNGAQIELAGQDIHAVAINLIAPDDAQGVTVMLYCCRHSSGR